MSVYLGHGNADSKSFRMANKDNSQVCYCGVVFRK